MPSKLADEITNDQIKKYINDDNGGKAIVFCAIFDRMGDVKSLVKENTKAIKSLVESISPILEKNKKAETINNFFASTKGKVLSYISAVMLISSFVGMVIACMK